jgi:hypothetical protein
MEGDYSRFSDRPHCHYRRAASAGQSPYALPAERRADFRFCTAMYGHLRF